MGAVLVGSGAWNAAGGGGGGSVSVITAPYIYVYDGEATPTVSNYKVQYGTVNATPSVGSTLICQHGHYTNDILDSTTRYPLRRSYQWYRNGVALTGQDGQTYALVNADAGQSITCKESLRVVPYPAGTSSVASNTPDLIAETPAVVPTGTRTSTLVYPDNIEYLGGFRVPNDGTFADGGYGLAWNAANGSLFINGAYNLNKTAEILVPTDVNILDVPVASMMTATYVQSPVDATEGWMVNGHAAGVDLTRLCGNLVYGGRLIQSAFHEYANGTAARSHASRPLTLTTTGNLQYTGLSDSVRGYTNPRFYGGQMCHVPPAWQSALGGPVLTGAWQLSIVSNSSDGPLAASFNPANITGASTTPATMLMRYGPQEMYGGPFENDGSGPWGVPHPIQSTGTSMGYTSAAMVIPFGTDSLLYIGENAEGSWTYGGNDQLRGPTSIRGVAGQYTRIYGEGRWYTGPHAPPYTTRVWAYRLSDLAASKSLTKAPGSLRPYAMWNLEKRGDAGAYVRSGCYDPATRRLFLAEALADTGYRPVIRVYRINNAVAV